MNATKTTWTKVANSQLSKSYWVCDQDPTQHVYRHRRVWVRASVVDKIARSHSVHATKAEAKA